MKTWSDEERSILRAGERCPVEEFIDESLTALAIRFQYNETAPNGRVLDFYLTDFDLWLEVKQFHASRVVHQIDGLTNVILIQGMPAARAFIALLQKAPSP